MRFGLVPVSAAKDGILAHAIRLGTGTLRKGTRIGPQEIAQLQAHLVEEILVAQTEAGDVEENEAADRIGQALLTPGLNAGEASTGRVNIYASAPGILVVDASLIDRINRLDESLTLATLPSFAPVKNGSMVATIKIIPFTAPETTVAAAVTLAAGGGAINLRRSRPRPVTLIQTMLPGIKTSVLDRTAAVTRARLSTLGVEAVAEHRVTHACGTVAAAVQEAIAEGAGLVLIVGASAITDRRDVIPAAITASGGVIEHFGMPVDPGNLLLLARVGQIPVLGLPGCARSPRLNGFDWILERLMTDTRVTADDITAMGVGGLLMEMPGRPVPRVRASPAPKKPIRPTPKVAAVILAAGQSTRMRGANKLLLPVAGQPMVRHVLETVARSRASPIILVTGHDAAAVRMVTADCGNAVKWVHNPDYAAGISASLRVGLAAVPADAEACVVVLGDMPAVTPQLIDRLIDSFDPAAGHCICVPTIHGRRGNPVLWDRRFFVEMSNLIGDSGARTLIDHHATQVTKIRVDDVGILLDIDTPTAFAAIELSG